MGQRPTHHISKYILKKKKKKNEKNVKEGPTNLII